MKKLIVILLLIGAISQESQAKIQAGVGIKVGPAFGRWNNYFLRGRLSTVGGTLGFQPGLHAGVQGRVWINKFVGINLAAEFNMVGNKFNGTKGTVITNVVHKENQITVPLSVMVGWANERLRMFGNFGGYFGYAFSGTDVTKINNNGSETSTGKIKADYKNVYRNIDAGVRIGAGLQVYVDKKLKSCVTFDINYDYGMTTVYRGIAPSYFNKPENLKIQNSKLMIGVGFLYTFGKSQAEEKPKRPVPVATDEN